MEVLKHKPALYYSILLTTAKAKATATTAAAAAAMR
jgi:hypothetical protein